MNNTVPRTEGGKPLVTDFATVYKQDDAPTCIFKPFVPEKTRLKPSVQDTGGTQKGNRQVDTTPHVDYIVDFCSIWNIPRVFIWYALVHIYTHIYIYIYMYLFTWCFGLYLSAHMQNRWSEFAVHEPFLAAADKDA
jgi:hypothetical protein